jgi:hypothetical protein
MTKKDATMTPELKEAARKCPVVAALHKVGETPEGIILILTNLRAQQLKDVADLKLLVPKLVKMSDGSMRIWRCPERLIPIDEYSPFDIGNAVWSMKDPEPTETAND